MRRNNDVKQALLICLLACATSLLTPVVNAQDADVTVAFVESDLREFIDLTAKATGKRFIVDPRVAGTVTLRSRQPLTSEETFLALLSVVDHLGFRVVAVEGHADLFKILLADEARPQLLDVNRRQGP